MNFIKKIFLLSLCGGYFFSGSSYAFLGEDLGLDLYKQIDEGFESLEKKQYEYELSGQGETEINEVLKPIFADYGITCNIGSARNIDEMLSDGNVNQIIARCGGEDGIVPAVLVERVTNALSYIKRTYTSRAQSKSQKTYEVAKIGLYSDGNIENSPFDLVSDLLEIDKIIFTQELEYEGVPYEKSADQALDDFLNEDKSYLYPEEELDEEDEMGDDTVEEGDEGNDEQEDIPDVIEILDYHNYVCAPDSIDSGLDDDILGDLLDNIEGTGGYVSNPRYWEYPGGINPLGGDIWGGPFTGGTTLTNVFSPVSDSWPCDGFFCIIIEFQKSNYGLAGGESMTIETVLKRAAKHFEKASNASPTQRKQTTNNFELGSIIKDLPGMLRGFGIEVLSKPVPILDVENDREDVVEGDLFEIQNLLSQYYKNQGLDYERRNDISIFGSKEHEQKVFQTAGGMPIAYAEDRLNKLETFKNALAENNRQVSQAVDNEIITSDLAEFSKLFSELEIFVAAIEDFAYAYTGNLKEMKQIPSRSP